VARTSKNAPAPLPERIEKARREARAEQALALAEALYRGEPTEANAALLRQAYLDRGRQLAEQGRTRDAAAVYAAAAEWGGPPEYLAAVAERLALHGDLDRARQVAERAGDPKVVQLVLGHAADRALQRGPAGKNSLPAELHPAFDLILTAFAQAEAGADDAARETLQGVGLLSPFLEWKLLLRGLLAYYANDDARAVENWQRLDPRRLPYRVAAPLRFAIDRDFARAQPTAGRQALLHQADRLHGTDLVTQLQAVQQALAEKKSFGAAFRQAEAVLPALRSTAPHLMPRLAHCFFWAIVNQGQPEDLQRYDRVFGTNTDRADVCRLEAIALEKRAMWPEANRAWQKFIAAVAASPAGTSETGRRLQALAWAHMGENAACADAPDDGLGGPFGYLFFEKPKPFKPTAEDCYKRSIELAPDGLDGYLGLFRLLLEQDQPAKAKKIGHELLKRFPEHVETSEALGDLCLETRELDQARAYYEKALAANPLERRLRTKLGLASQNLALARTAEGQLDAARTEYEAARALWEGPPGPLLCQMAVLELKAKKPDRANELVTEALAAPADRLAVKYALVGAAVRAKLPPAQRKRLADDLAEALAQPPTPAEVLALLESAAVQRRRHLEPFRGQKTHEKAILGFLDQIPFDAFDEAQAERLCYGLHSLNARRPWERVLDWAECRYQANPVFALSHLEFLLTRSNPARNLFALRSYLDKIRRQVAALPAGPRKERVAAILKEKEEQVRELDEEQSQFYDLLGDFFDLPFGKQGGNR
jgi:hypothetical protein